MMVEGTCGCMWTPFKELCGLVEAAVLRQVTEVIPDLEVALRKHKPSFITLLKNTGRNSQDRETLLKGTTEGITFRGTQTPQMLSQQIVDEAIILSDMYDINEIVALDLLLAGEQQMPDHLDLTRGLVAVLLYYDGRKALVNSLRVLIQARKGLTWTLELSEELTDLATTYTDQIMEEGLVDKILTLLTDLDLTKELDKLQKNRALGVPRHRRQVLDLFQGIRQCLAEILFSWAAQTGLKKDEVLRLMDYLSKVKTEEILPGGLNSISVTLLNALLYGLDASYLQKRDDGEEVIQRLPIVADATFIPAIHKELGPTGKKWETLPLQAVVQFAWAMTLCTLRSLPQNVTAQGYVDEDESMIDAALEQKVFHFISSAVLSCDSVFKEEFYLRRLHTLITDFIIQMPLKVKELRNRADEAARTILVYAQEGLEAPSHLPQHFEQLLHLVAQLYGQDPLKLELALEYWCPTEGAAQSAVFSFRLPQRQVSLYKFVRLAGDLLPPSLYIPYVNMLCSLASTPQSAHHAFNLLKLNGTGQGSTVSWDHFFSSLNRYYSNLRQELPPTSDTVYRHHPLTKGITPQEVQGLQAVLRLIRAVAENDEYARVALCENPVWMPLVLMLGLVACSVPAPLKAELLRTLAAFARSPDIAHSLWQSLEASQVLATVPSTSSYRTRGIQTELEEVEAQNEEYPLTLALLHLLNSLTDVTVPPMLGAGTRAPGFDPYLDFIQNSVFLRFNTRSYRKEAEKWEVAASCLEILYKLLRGYEPSIQSHTDTVVELQAGGTAVVNKPPGYQLLVSLLHDSAFLRMILYVLDEGCHHLDTFTDVPGQKHLERSTLLCLKIISSAFGHQEAFLELIRAQESPLLVVSLDKLLLGMNPRSGKPDHMLNIAKYITYHMTLPDHALAAVQILLVVTALPASHPQLLAVFTSSSDMATLIRHGFVECLENEEEELQEEDEGEHSAGKSQGATRIAILKLLLQCLDHPPPNIAHFLLGFDLKKPIYHSTLQQPGVLNSPRTCLHLLLTILDSGAAHCHGPAAVSQTPHLAELAYRVLYCLCANSHTSDPVLRFLRSTPDFLTRHLSYLPFRGEPNVHNLMQMSWLLKTIAIELKVMATNRQRSHLQRIISLLVESVKDETIDTSEIGMLWGDTTIPATQLSCSHMLTRSKPVRHRLLSLIDILDFSIEKQVMPQWEYFDPSQLEKVIKNCEQRSDLALKLVNIRQLHKLLHAELATLQGTAAIGQRQLIAQEIQNILLYAVKRNYVRERAAARRSYLDAWRHVTETLLTATPMEALSRGVRKQLFLELIQALLTKVLADSTLPELANQVSGVILIFLSNLHHCYSMDAATSPAYVTLLGSGTESGLGGRQQSAGYSSALQVILKGLVEWVIKIGGTIQRVRANLYGALLNYLRIGQSNVSTVRTEPVSGISERQGRQLSPASEAEKHRQANVEVIVSYGDSFLETLCRDCCSGHDIGKMLALSCLDMLIAMDGRGRWITYLSSQGYLQHLIESFLVEDEQLITLLSPQLESLRPLYIFESKMAMLTRCASTASGAQLLLQNGLMGKLAEMKVFDVRPEVEYSSYSAKNEGFLPSTTQRYRQIFLSSLRLCQAVLTSLGMENKSVTTQVLHFLLAHGEAVHATLRSRLSPLNLPALEELSLLTGVIARAAAEDITEDSLDTSVLEIQGQIMHLQNRMLALIPHFILSDWLLKQVAALPETRDGRDIREETMIALLQVACNLLLYAKNIVSRSGMNAKYCRILFSPSLMEAMKTDIYSRDDPEGPVGIAAKPPSLGVIVRQLRQTVAFFHMAHQAQETVAHKLALVQEMSSQELEEFLPALASEKLTTAACKTLATQRLKQLVRYKDQELQYCSLLVESTLFLLWRHLEHFLLYAAPPATPSLYQEAMRKMNDIPFEGDVGSPMLAGRGGISQEDIRKLKESAAICINDAFFKKLEEMEQQYLRNRTHFGFVDALIRRIKRLVKLYTV